MWPLSAAAALMLEESHAIDVRVTVVSPTAGQITGLAVSGGEVVADATSKVRRTATIQVSPEHWPVSPQGLLAPYGSTATIEYGIIVPDGSTEWVPVFHGYLDNTSRTRPLSGSGDIEVKLVDPAARVAEDRFDSPTQTVSGATVVSEITRLVQQTLPGTAVIDLTGSTQVAPVMEIEQERWDGVEQLADSIGAEAFFDTSGRLVIRPQPTVDDTVVWTVRVGDRGSVITAKDILTRDGVYNRVVAVGQRSDGTPPVQAVVSDTDPESPTLYGGPFGRKPRRYSSPLLTTVDQAATAAAALLARVRGVAARVEVETLPNPALEPGDVVLVDAVDGTQTRHILDRVTIPLDVASGQSLGTRSPDLPPEQ